MKNPWFKIMNGGLGEGKLAMTWQGTLVLAVALILIVANHYLTPYLLGDRLTILIFLGVPALVFIALCCLVAMKLESPLSEKSDKR